MKRFLLWLDGPQARIVLLAVAALSAGLAVGLWAATVLR